MITMMIIAKCIEMIWNTQEKGLFRGHQVLLQVWLPLVKSKSWNFVFQTTLNPDCRMMAQWKAKSLSAIIITRSSSDSQAECRVTGEAAILVCILDQNIWSHFTTPIPPGRNESIRFCGSSQRPGGIDDKQSGTKHHTNQERPHHHHHHHAAILASRLWQLWSPHHQTCLA